MSESLEKYHRSCLYFAANSFSRYINAMAEESFRKTGMSPSYGYLMLMLIEKPGLSQNELSQQMNLKASTMTRFIDKLLTMNYVRKEQQGRNSFIYPTSEGIAQKVLIDQALSDLYKKYCDVLGEEFAVKLTEDIYQANKDIETK
ncbi:MarR family winged helix-turn-helix transcriptional regulator [Aureibacter tunicatorum]|uniref:DNA-binding MarR family transcriptional regulator n=1 Tax=Aureibacter tunicatorum TaxID=866807 RepID=A0AAE4BUH2_9BACT|nr:MarR family transcriptional regulator [Aureibacter tunicatorum]MDR6240763.1 DNA-binding MarR family transcriptional regulator [Aureibacter tunicatorum]BDD06904.1 hypothetical protein AUTU_43870 [Aureibacter tunicatorum]